VPTAALRAGVTRADVLHALIPRVRDAAHTSGDLADTELARWSAHDMAVGRRCSAPVAGVVADVQLDGALRVLLADGRESTHRSGSLVFIAEEEPC
jgi:hypothetical protein